jgi:hypothetical protein
MGYHVGHHGAPTGERRKILATVFATPENRLPHVPHREAWGEASSSLRLQKIANCLASFCRNLYANEPRHGRQAIQDWESDLKWLQETYYRHGAFHFDLPRDAGLGRLQWPRVCAGIAGRRAISLSVAELWARQCRSLLWPVTVPRPYT